MPDYEAALDHLKFIYQSLKSDGFLRIYRIEEDFSGHLLRLFPEKASDIHPDLVNYSMTWDDMEYFCDVSSEVFLAINEGYAGREEIKKYLTLGVEIKKLHFGTQDMSLEDLL